MDSLNIYTDGACSVGGQHNGTGGWSYLLSSDRLDVCHSGAVRETTNNRMEITAFIESMKYVLSVESLLSNIDSITIYTDSNLVLNTLKKGSTWKRNKNHDLWEIADELIQTVESLFDLEIQWVWVKAHTNGKDKHSVHNNRVDHEAVKARDLLKKTPSMLDYCN